MTEKEKLAEQAQRIALQTLSQQSGSFLQQSSMVTQRPFQQLNALSDTPRGQEHLRGIDDRGPSLEGIDKRLKLIEAKLSIIYNLITKGDYDAEIPDSRTDADT